MRVRSLAGFTLILLFTVTAVIAVRQHPAAIANQIDDALRLAQKTLGRADVTSALNESITTTLQASGLDTHQISRVVPIVGANSQSAGLRLAQVTGEHRAVQRVKAVMEIDAAASADPWQFAALIPVSSISDHGRGHRVEGIGITAIVTR